MILDTDNQATLEQREAEVLAVQEILQLKKKLAQMTLERDRLDYICEQTVLYLCDDKSNVKFIQNIHEIMEGVWDFDIERWNINRRENDG